jgi:hypothetical protein
MKLKYSLITLVLLTLNCSISGQTGNEFNSHFPLTEIPSIIQSSGVQKISLSSSMFYTGPVPSNQIINYTNHFKDAYFNDNMPTLNQLKNSMLRNIEVTGVPSAVLKFKYDEDEKKENDEESESFFTSSLFYFLGAAALATTFYFVWQDTQDETSTRTFGYPPRPETEP